MILVVYGYNPNTQELLCRTGYNVGTHCTVDPFIHALSQQEGMARMKKPEEFDFSDGKTFEIDIEDSAQVFKPLYMPGEIDIAEGKPDSDGHIKF